MLRNTAIRHKNSHQNPLMDTKKHESLFLKYRALIPPKRFNCWGIHKVLFLPKKVLAENLRLLTEI
jgi:hypothetical protein